MRWSILPRYIWRTGHTMRRLARLLALCSSIPAGALVLQPHRQHDRDGRTDYRREAGGQSTVRLDVGNFEMAEECDRAAVAVGGVLKHPGRIGGVELAHFDPALRREHVLLEPM